MENDAHDRGRTAGSASAGKRHERTDHRATRRRRDM